VRIGNPAKEIIREAQEGKYDLLIMGGRQRRHTLSRFLLGSTTLRVVKYAPCSVLIVKGNARPIRRILLCDSGAGSPSVGISETACPSAKLRIDSLSLSRFAARLAPLLEVDVEITVLHVMSQITAGPGVNGKQLRAGAEELIAEGTLEGELLKQDVRVLVQSGIRSRPKVRHGLVVDQILSEAQRGDYDLVIIGAYRGKGTRHILLDDLTYKILSPMDRPVLVVR
jgi:nucleotide-binding universal stress UspA family protein